MPQVDQANWKAKKARLARHEGADETLPLNARAASSNSASWRPSGRRSGHRELGGTRPEKVVKDIPSEK